MYNINRDNTIYLYSYHNQQWIASFDTEESLVRYLAVNYEAFFGENNDVQLTGNDTRRANFTDGFVLRNYLFKDAYNVVVNPLVYKPQVDEFLTAAHDEANPWHREYIRHEICNKWRKYTNNRIIAHDTLQPGDILCECDINYRFRQDPVPGIGRNRWHFACWYRAPRTTAELRDMADPEVQPYVRKKRKTIPTAYDDITRGYQRSWKRQSKKSKQWM
jgi:hypothetical protein